MVLPFNDRYKRYDPVVPTTDFIVDFPIFDDADLDVFVDGTETTEYSVSSTYVSGIATNAVVVLSSAASGVPVEIYGSRQPARAGNYLGNSPFFPFNIQRDLDAITAVQQELFREHDGFTADISQLQDDLDQTNEDLADIRAPGGGLQPGIVTPDSLSDNAFAEYFEDQEARQKVLQTFSGDGVTKSFVLSAEPGARANLTVVVDGVTQLAKDLTLLGDTITFTGDAPAIGVNNIDVYVAEYANGIRDADGLSFAPFPGEGGQARFISEKLSDVVSVKDFGGGIGGDDDAAFSLAALAAVALDTLGPPNNTSTVPRADTSHVVIPAGDYTLTETVDVGNNDITWELSPGAKITGSDYLNGRVSRAGKKVTHGYPYGILDTAAGYTVTLGGEYSDKPAPITGVADVEALVDYPNVDGVALVGAAYSTPALIPRDAADCSYTSSGVSLSPVISTDQDRRLRKGMVIYTRHATPYVGVVDSWSTAAGETTISLSGGWYIYDNSAAGVQTPPAGFGCDIGVTTKIWGGNFVTNLSADGAAKQAIGCEISSRNLLGASTTDTDDTTNRVWGYLSATVAAGTPGYYATQAAFIARGGWIYGLVSDDQDVGFYYKTTGSGKTALKTRMPGGETILYAEDTLSQQRYVIGGGGDTQHGDPDVSAGSGRSIAFHTSGGGSSYDSRILAEGGSATLGMGTLTFQAIDNKFGGVVRPTQDNVRTLGSASTRWSTVYAGTGTINTSDERAKQDIGSVPDEWLDAWGSVQWSRYRWKEAVAAKGDAARWHTGLIAQAVEKAFADVGLDAFEIGLLCLDPVTEIVTETIEEQRPVMEDAEEAYEIEEVDGDRIVVRQRTRVIQKPKVRSLPVMDESGKPVMEEVLDPGVPAGASEEEQKRKVMVPKVRTVPVMETVQVEISVERATGETRYGLRYDECFALEAAWVRRELARMKEKI